MTAAQRIRRLANLETRVDNVDSELEAIGDLLSSLTDASTFDSLSVHVNTARGSVNRCLRAIRAQLQELEALEVA